MLPAEDLEQEVMLSISMLGWTFGYRPPVGIDFLTPVVRDIKKSGVSKAQFQAWANMTSTFTYRDGVQDFILSAYAKSENLSTLKHQGFMIEG